MKISLIHPRLVYPPSQPPLGLGYIAAYLEKAGHEVQFIEAAFSPDDEAVVQSVKAFGAQLIGISVMISYFTKAIELSALLKRHLPDVPTVFGGPHPSVVPDDFLKYDSVDFVLVGEGEHTFTKMATAMERGEFEPENIAGLHWKAHGMTRRAMQCATAEATADKRQEKEVNVARIVPFKKSPSRVAHQAQADRITDLDELPWPARHLMPMDQYQHRGYNVSFGMHGSNFNIMTTRGCPYKCNFCDHSVFGRKPVSRDIKDVVDEIEDTAKRYNIRNFDIMDDTFTMNRNYVLEFCDELISRNLNLFWCCRMRVTKVTREVMKKMAEAGCVRFSLGIESVDPGVLKSIEKNISTDEVTRLLKWAKEFNILTIGNFMIGNIGDTRETIYKTLAYSLNTKEIDIPSWVILVPLPGTQAFEVGKKNGWIRTFDWDDYRMNSKDLPIWRNEALSHEELRDIYADIARQVRPKVQYAMDVLHQERLKYYPELKKYASA